jgi:hypothetical protein
MKCLVCSNALAEIYDAQEHAYQAVARFNMKIINLHYALSILDQNELFN